MSQNKEQDEESGVLVDEEDPGLDEPRQFAVFLHNDHYTTMEFVIEVLERFFGKNKEQATQIMLNVHNKGKGVAGVYQYQIAETKVSQVTEHARSNGFPLKCTAEPVSGEQ